MRIALIAGFLLTCIAETAFCHGLSPEVEVLISGVPVPRYYHKGTTYLEATKGREYEIRITNPTGSRVAVALSVDGLNSIDARRTEARKAQKWVLEPYQSIVISGWQTNARQARRFFFTTEERSYGAWLHKTENLGIISAVFFRERIRRVQPVSPSSQVRDSGKSKEEAEVNAAGAEPPQSARGEAKAALHAEPAEYAATGIGGRIRHEVEAVHMDLEDQPFAAVNLRYEFRSALVRLGVIPPRTHDDALARRERSRGFESRSFCPEP